MGSGDRAGVRAGASFPVLCPCHTPPANLRSLGTGGGQRSTHPHAPCPSPQPLAGRYEAGPARFRPPLLAGVRDVGHGSSRPRTPRSLSGAPAAIRGDDASRPGTLLPRRRPLGAERGSTSPPAPRFLRRSLGTGHRHHPARVPILPGAPAAEQCGHRPRCPRRGSWISRGEINRRAGPRGHHPRGPRILADPLVAGSRDHRRDPGLLAQPLGIRQGEHRPSEQRVLADPLVAGQWNHRTSEQRPVTQPLVPRRADRATSGSPHWSGR